MAGRPAGSGRPVPETASLRALLAVSFTAGGGKVVRRIRYRRALNERSSARYNILGNNQRKGTTTG